jgi:preprotein translocase subunit SecA
VHIVTVNDFLVMRDAAWMSPIYKFLGLTVGTITEGMDAEARRAAYACDITYGTNKQVVFDYLKDRLMLGRDARRCTCRSRACSRSTRARAACCCAACASSSWTKPTAC